MAPTQCLSRILLLRIPCMWAITSVLLLSEFSACAWFSIDFNASEWKYLRVCLVRVCLASWMFISVLTSHIPSSLFSPSVTPSTQISQLVTTPQNLYSIDTQFFKLFPIYFIQMFSCFSYFIIFLFYLEIHYFFFLLA